MHATPRQRVATVPRVTLYVREADAPVWDRARALTSGSEDSLSSLVTEGLTQVVERRERQLRAEKNTSDRMGPVELNGVDWYDEDKPRKLRFSGVVVSEQGRAAVYITRGKKVVVEVVDRMGSTRIVVFDSFEEFRDTREQLDLDPSSIIETADAMGEEYYEEID